MYTYRGVHTCMIIAIIVVKSPSVSYSAVSYGSSSLVVLFSYFVTTHHRHEANYNVIFEISRSSSSLAIAPSSLLVPILSDPLSLLLYI